MMLRCVFSRQGPKSTVWLVEHWEPNGPIEALLQAGLEMMRARAAKGLSHTSTDTDTLCVCMAVAHSWCLTGVSDGVFSNTRGQGFLADALAHLLTRTPFVCAHGCSPSRWWPVRWLPGAAPWSWAMPKAGSPAGTQPLAGLLPFPPGRFSVVMRSSRGQTG